MKSDYMKGSTISQEGEDWESGKCKKWKSETWNSFLYIKIQKMIIHIIAIDIQNLATIYFVIKMCYAFWALRIS